jgi:hypothetical protein
MARVTRLAAGKIIKPPERYEPVVDGPLEDDLSASDLSEDEEDEMTDSEKEFDPDNPDTDSDMTVGSDVESEDESEDEDEDLGTENVPAAESRKRNISRLNHGNQTQ